MFILAAVSLLAASLSVRAATHPIAVGGSGSLTFNPTSVTAVAGDTVVFTFESGSHTATQSTFAAPCTALQGGVDSGPKPAAATPPTFNYTVTDANPVWFYCATGTHCKSGMVFAVNPSADQSFAAFQAAAKGESPSSSAGSSSSASGTATTSLSATAKLSGPDATTSASATQKDNSGSGYGYGSGGGASGRAPIAVGAVAAALILGSLAAI